MEVCFRAACGVLTLTGIVLGGGYQQSVRIKSVVRPDARTGRLVRSVTVTPRRVISRAVQPRPAPPSRVQPGGASDLLEAVERVAQQHALPPPLIHSIIKVESNYNPYAVSSKGALGLMQLIPATARRFGVQDVFDPLDNLQGGARYLKYLLDLYGSYPLALAAYNAGEGAVERYGGIPPYRETIDYVARVRKNWQSFQLSETHGQQEHSAAAELAPEYNRIRQVTDASGAIYYVSQ